ncbi:aminotransferase-like domain-containing protein [Paenibacillus sp. CMAA1364]
MKYSFATRTERISSSLTNQMRLNSQRGTFISLAEDWPTADILPHSALSAATRDVLNHVSHTLECADVAGYTPLRQWLQLEWKQHKQMDIDMNQILVTTGSEQALDLLATTYINVGDTVLIENPTSPNNLQILRMRGAIIVPLEVDDDGIHIHQLLEYIEIHHPKFLLVTPNFNNPTGMLWSLERRKRVLEICREYEILIVEDDSYGELYYEEGKENESFGIRYPSLCTLDDHGRGGQVLQIVSFSKIVAPSLSTGFVIGPKEVIEVMAASNRFLNRQYGDLNQRVLYELLKSSTFDWHEHLAALRREFRHRLKLMTELLKRPAWSKATYKLPSGGMFLWVQLIDGLPSDILLKCSISKGATFGLGEQCYVDRKNGLNLIRLNFALPRRDELLLGMHLIGDAVTEFTARS